MTSPAYVSSGAFDQEGTSLNPLTPALPADLVAGNILFLVFEARGATPTATMPTDWELVNEAVEIINNITSYIWARLVPDPPESLSVPSIDWSSGGGTDAAQAKIHQYTNPAGHASVTAMIEAKSAVASGSDLTAEIPSVTCGGTDRLAVATLNGLGINLTGPPTGETGGDYVTDDSSYWTGNNIGQAIFSADMVSGGTISGGVAPLTGTVNWYCTAFALVGSVVVGGMVPERRSRRFQHMMVR